MNNQTKQCGARSLSSRFIYASYGALGASIFLLWLTLVPSAMAGLPLHSRNPALDISGFNHACGAAVDSKGNTYVSSAGESKIKVFDPSHVELTSITDSNEPCALAVNTEGTLFASEKATGEVVRYVPSAYPPSGSTTYSAAETIDNSGSAKGISVDPADDRLYVADESYVSVYDSEGKLGIDEVQRILCFECTGGFYKLSFGGEETDQISYEATAAEVKAKLEALSTVGPGNIAVSGDGVEHVVTFIGKFAHTDVGSLVADPAELVGPVGVRVIVEEKAKGFNGHIGDGVLTEASGVAAYTYARTDDDSSGRYLFVADPHGASADKVYIFSGKDIRALKLRRELDGPQQGEPFSFGAGDTYLTVDPGNQDPTSKTCISIDEQACTAGHFLVFDRGNTTVDEFDATGTFLDQFDDPAFTDSQPTALAIDRSGGVHDGSIYVTAGAGAAARLIAFDPLVIPSRVQLNAPMSHVLKNATAVTVDSAGNVYIVAEKKIFVYGPAGGLLTEFDDLELGEFADLAVDSAGNLYTLEKGQQVTYYTPSAYPPINGTTYSRHAPPIATLDSFSRHTPSSTMRAIGINSVSDHLLVAVSPSDQVIELDSAKKGSAILKSDFGSGLGIQDIHDIAAYGANGNVYVSSNFPVRGFVILDSEGIEIIARVSGAGSPEGRFNWGPEIAVDQSNGQVLTFGKERGVAEEYDASGAFIAEFGEFQTVDNLRARIAIDNGNTSPNKGIAYIAYDELAPNTPDLWAFGPLSYGEPPIAVTGIASDVGTGNATLNGAVDPRGFEVEDCHFEYLTNAEYLAEGETFTGAISKPCAESLAEIGKGTGPHPVHVDISGLEPEARYRFRLLAKNKYGASEGKVFLFGPPVLTPEAAQPVLYDEATFRAEIDTSGLATKYYVEYGPDTGYGQSTPIAELAPGGLPVAVEIPVTGLADGTEYHFRVVVESEAKTVIGPDQQLRTLRRADAQDCVGNAEFRTGLSANLPDCRVYELATPAESRGLSLGSALFGSQERTLSNWLVAPRGEGAGESLAFFTTGTLPGFDGNGFTDGYRAQRAPGLHPTAGWNSEIFAPSFTQTGGFATSQLGVSSDQRYSFWSLGGNGSMPAGEYLHTPTGFEAVGGGSLGADPNATSLVVSAGGQHVVFSSSMHLEEAAAPEGTAALYERKAGAAGAEVISMKPGGGSFGSGESASYVGTPQDGGAGEGAAIAFRVAGALYLHREGQTAEVAEAPNTFAGVSADGKQVFYTKAGNLYVCDTQAGSCAGEDKVTEATEIAPKSTFVNVSSNGLGVYFASKEILDGAEEGTLGANNLYLSDGTSTRFVAILDPLDLSENGFGPAVSLGAWTNAVAYGAVAGRGFSPTRSTPDGEVLLFLSHAQLSTYDNKGFVEAYRYDALAAPAQRLTCLSCDPSGTAPSADATLESLPSGKFLGSVRETNLIPSLTDDGKEAFFESDDRLLPEDANDAKDVYEWQAEGAGDCNRAGGCLALISSGQGESGSYLFGMSADGDDVFFSTTEKLVGQDVAGGSSIYDARVGGGIPDLVAEESCQGDACQGNGSTPPALPAPASTGAGNGNLPSAHCPKGKHRVKGRCVTKHRKRKHHHKRSQHRANADRRTHR